MPKVGESNQLPNYKSLTKSLKCDTNFNWLHNERGIKLCQWWYSRHWRCRWLIHERAVPLLRFNSSVLTHILSMVVFQFHCEELRILILSKCRKLECLPNDINKLVKLKSLALQSCSSLSSLPDSLGDLAQLEKLELSGCKLLQKLPPIDCGLKKLRVLRMAETGLTRLPEDSLKTLANFLA